MYIPKQLAYITFYKNIFAVYIAPRRLLPMTRVYVCIDVCKIARQLNSSVYLRQQILSEIILRMWPMW